MTGDIARSTIAEWEREHGTPIEWNCRQPVSNFDFEGIRKSQKKGRAHDITLYIERAGRLAVIAKPVYPPGLFRAPSGGLHPGEPLQDGAVREAYEETGLRVSIERYLLRAHVVFDDCGNEIHWWTHVFTATTSDENIVPIDTQEIREARWADPSEFDHFSALMTIADRGGLRYRAALHQQVARLHPLFQNHTR